MTPYYIIFIFFLSISIFLRYSVIEAQATTLPLMIGYGLLVYPPLVLLYFLVLFYLTHGMQYFVVRKPAIFHVLKFKSK